MTSNANSGRWAELCDLYKQAHEKGSDEYFRMGRLAIHLRKAVATSCGCDEKYVYFYSFKHGPIPQYDTAEMAENGWRSIRETEKGWVFALGVLLEIDERTHPKTIVRFPVEAEIKGNSFNVESSVFRGLQEIRGEAEHYASDIAATGEKIYHGLRQALTEPDGEHKRIGFHAL